MGRQSPAACTRACAQRRLTLLRECLADVFFIDLFFYNNYFFIYGAAGRLAKGLAARSQALLAPRRAVFFWYFYGPPRWRWLLRLQLRCCIFSFLARTDAGREEGVESCGGGDRQNWGRAAEERNGCNVTYTCDQIHLAPIGIELFRDLLGTLTRCPGTLNPMNHEEFFFEKL